MVLRSSLQNVATKPALSSALSSQANRKRWRCGVRSTDPLDISQPLGRPWTASTGTLRIVSCTHIAGVRLRRPKAFFLLKTDQRNDGT